MATNIKQEPFHTHDLVQDLHAFMRNTAEVVFDPNAFVPVQLVRERFEQTINRPLNSTDLFFSNVVRRDPFNIPIVHESIDWHGRVIKPCQYFRGIDLVGMSVLVCFPPSSSLTNARSLSLSVEPPEWRLQQMAPGDTPGRLVVVFSVSLFSFARNNPFDLPAPLPIVQEKKKKKRSSDTWTYTKRRRAKKAGRLFFLVVHSLTSLLTPPSLVFFPRHHPKSRSSPPSFLPLFIFRINAFISFISPE